MPIHKPLPVISPRRPTVVRFGSDRSVLDAPWGLALRAIANLWPNSACSEGWARAWWPRAGNGWSAVAPLDLQVGHVLELTTVDGAVAYGWVADVDKQRFVLAAAPDATCAVELASQAVAVWHAAELARVEGEWQRRIKSVQP